VVVIATLYFARVVLVPFALAMLFSFLLSPLVRGLERARLPRAVSVLLVVVISMAVVGSIGVAVTNQLVDVTNQLPNYKANIKEKVESVRGTNRAALVRATEAISELSKEMVETPSAKVPTAHQHNRLARLNLQAINPSKWKWCRSLTVRGSFYMVGWARSGSQELCWSSQFSCFCEERI